MIEDITKISPYSMDIENEELTKLKKVFPQCFSEGSLDIDKLLSLCGKYIDKDFEKYKFEWSGKSECYRIAGKRSTGTLRPCPEESVNFDTTNNLYIEGDNLEVLKLLQSSYYNKIKMIYIDPPYNTGSDDRSSHRRSWWRHPWQCGGLPTHWLRSRTRHRRRCLPHTPG